MSFQGPAVPLGNITGSIQGSAPPKAAAPLETKTAPELSPEAAAYLHGSDVPDPTQELSNALTPPVRGSQPEGPPDPYAGMEDYMFSQSLRPHLTSPLAFLGALGSDRDSIEAIVKKNNPKAKVTHHNGNLIIDEDGKKFIFNTGKPQLGDVLRGAAGTAIAAPIAGVTAGALPALAPAIAAIIGTGVANRALGKLRYAAGGAPPSALEDAGAMALHGLIHGGGKLASMAANMEHVAPGLTAATAEGAAIPPGYTPPPVSNAPPSEVPVAPAAPVAPTAPAPLPPAQAVSPAAQSVAQAGDDLVRQITPELDRSELNRSFRGRLAKHLIDTKKAVKAAFAPVDTAMSGVEVGANRTLEFIDKLERENGDIPQWLRKIREDLTPTKPKEGPPTAPLYGKLDEIRKDVGRRSRASGGLTPDGRGDQNIAKGLYGEILADQVENADAHGVGDSLRAAQSDAKKFIDYRGRVRTQFGRVIGEAIEKDVTPKIDRGLKALGEGAPSALRTTMEAVPPEMRSDALMTTVATKFGDLSAGEPFDLKKFGPWFKKVLGNKDSARAMAENLEPKAWQGLQDLHSVYQQLESVTAEDLQRRATAEAEHAAATAKYKAEKQAWDSGVKADKEAARLANRKPPATPKHPKPPVHWITRELRDLTTTGGPIGYGAKKALRAQKVIDKAVNMIPWKRLAAAYNIPQGELAQRLQIGGSALAVGSPIFTGDSTNPPEANQ